MHTTVITTREDYVAVNGKQVDGLNEAQVMCEHNEQTIEHEFIITEQDNILHLMHNENGLCVGGRHAKTWFEVFNYIQRF